MNMYEQLYMQIHCPNIDIFCDDVTLTLSSNCIDDNNCPGY